MNRPHADIPLISESTNTQSDSTAEVDVGRFADLGRILDYALQDFPLERHVSVDQSIGSFRILTVLGSGGGGVVYLATDPILDRKVAIKVPHGSTLLNANSKARFLQEARLISELKHANIVEVFQVGETDQIPFIVLEYCAGHSLAEWLKFQRQPLAERQCAELILSLARAIEHAHGRGVLHRDLNPRNVLLVPLAETTDDTSAFPFCVKVSDFGLGTWLDERSAAVQTQSGAVMGTLPYMAPEQTIASDAPLQTTVDVYALGVMLYELLTLQRPFDGTTPAETLRKIHEGHAIPLHRVRKSIPQDLETICTKCLEREPAARYPSASLLVADLESFLEGNPIGTRRPSFSQQITRWIARRRTAIVIAGAAMVLAILVSSHGLSLTNELQTVRVREQQATLELATHSDKLAETQRDLDELNRQSQQRLDHLRKLEYVNQIGALSLRAKTHRVEVVNALRDLIPTSGETDLRSFEWYYLIHASGGDLAILPDAILKKGDMRRVFADDQSIFIADDRTIAEWDINARQITGRTWTVPRQIRDLAVSRKKRTLFVATLDSSSIEKFDLRPGNHRDRISEVEPTPYPCQRIRILPGEKEFLSIGNPSSSIHHPSVVAWHNHDGKITKILTWPEASVMDAIGDPENQNTIVAVNDGIEVYDKQHQKTQELNNLGHGCLLSLAITQNGRHLAISAENQTVVLCRKDAAGRWSVHNLATAKILNPRLTEYERIHVRYPLHFNFRGNRLFATRESGLTLFDVSSESGLTSRQYITTDPVQSSSPIFPEGEMLACTFNFSSAVWHPNTETPSFAGHPKEVWSVAFSPDGKWLASGSDDETIRIWDMNTCELRGELKGHQATVTHVAFSPDGRSLASASLDGSAKIWDVNLLQLKKTFNNHQGQVRGMAWTPDGDRLATSDSPGPDQQKRVLVWDLEMGQELHRFVGQNDRIPEIVITKDSKHLISVSDDRRVTMYSLVTCQDEWSELDATGIKCAVLLDHDRILATGNDDGLITLRDVATGKLVGTLQAHTDRVLSLAQSPDGRVLASGSLDRKICLWDIETKTLLLSLNDQETQINDLAFSPSGEILVAAMHDGSIKTFYAPRSTLPRIDSR